MSGTWYIIDHVSWCPHFSWSLGNVKVKYHLQLKNRVVALGYEVGQSLSTDLFRMAVYVYID